MEEEGVGVGGLLLGLGGVVALGAGDARVLGQVHVVRLRGRGLVPQQPQQDLS